MKPYEGGEEKLLATGNADRLQAGKDLSREEGLRRLLRFAVPHNAIVILLAH